MCQIYKNKYNIVLLELLDVLMYNRKNYFILKAMRLKICLFGVLLVNSSCATISDGKYQDVTITTGEETGAICRLQNSKGDWIVSSTPDVITIHRDFSELTILCKKGAKIGVASVESRTKGLAYGNALIGGLVGAAVDVSSGAAYDYPTAVNINLSE